MLRTFMTPIYSNISIRKQVGLLTLIRSIVLLGLIFIFAPPVYADADYVIPLPGARIAESNIVAADFNGDGRKEIVAAGYDGRVYVIDGATYSLIWNKKMTDYIPGFNSTFIESSLTIADLNNDGALELIIATGDDPIFRQVGAVIVLTYTGSGALFALMPGWPRYGVDETGNPGNPSFPDGVPDGFQATPAVGDLDNDGDLEIVIAGQDRRLHAWHHNGAYVTGWPIDRTKNLYRGGASSPALADIDKDGLLEIIVGTNSYAIPSCPNPYVLLALNGDSSLVPGFPVHSNQNFHSSPAIGDINGDGWLDIVVGAGDYNESCPQVQSIPDGHKVHAWDHTGHRLPGWPKTTAGNMLGSPALGDLDGDGDLEVVIGCGAPYQLASASCNLLYAWHGNGSNVAGFPMSPTGLNANYLPSLNVHPFTPILVDYDGDGVIEIMTVGGGSRVISIVEPNGAMNPDIRRTTANNMLASPLVDDIDGDGLLETVIGGATADGKAAVYIWDETGNIYNRRPWPMFHHDIARTGLYTPQPTPPQLSAPPELRIFHDLDDGDTATYVITIHNLGSPDFNWELFTVSPNIERLESYGVITTSANFKVRVNTSGAPLNTWYHVGDLYLTGTLFFQHVVGSPRTIPVWVYSGDFEQNYLPVISRR